MTTRRLGDEPAASASRGSLDRAACPTLRPLDELKGIFADGFAEQNQLDDGDRALASEDSVNRVGSNGNVFDPCADSDVCDGLSGPKFGRECVLQPGRGGRTRECHPRTLTARIDAQPAGCGNASPLGRWLF